MLAKAADLLMDVSYAVRTGKNVPTSPLEEMAIALRGARTADYERERCAKIAEEMAATLRTMNMAADGVAAAEAIAEKIREPTEESRSR